MTAKIHRWATTCAAIATGLGGLVAVPGYEPLGIPAEAGIGLIFAGAALTIIANAIRSNADPQ